MAAADAAYTRMNDSVDRVVGDAATLIQGSTETALTGVFSAPWTGVTVGGVPVQRETTTFEVADALLAELGLTLAEGDRLTVLGTTYTVVRIQPLDGPLGGGVTELTLAEYASA